MPSLVHEFYARVIPRLRGAGELDDAAAERARIERWHATPEFFFRALPTRLVPGFERRWETSTRKVPFPVHTIRPRGRQPRTTVYYLHGGGFVSPADAVHVRYATRLATLLDAEVVLPFYPLAPEHTWRDSHQALVDDVAEHTARQDRVVLAGDSAGGGLALARGAGAARPGARAAEPAAAARAVGRPDDEHPRHPRPRRGRPVAVPLQARAVRRLVGRRRGRPRAPRGLPRVSPT